jgi:phosphoserine phosphatase
MSAPVANDPSPFGVPLCVDLDGTLTRTDTLVEAVRALLRKRPWSIARLPFWLLAGKAAFKRKLAARVRIDPFRLPYNAGLLELLWAERRRGREIWLVTAADRRIADTVAAHVGLFDGVLASDGKLNLKGAEKLTALQKRFPGGFDYAGNSRADLVIWRGARLAIVVNARRRLVRAARAQARVARVIR